MLYIAVLSPCRRTACPNTADYESEGFGLSASLRCGNHVYAMAQIRFFDALENVPPLVPSQASNADV